MKKLIFAVPAVTTFVGIMTITSNNTVAWFLAICFCYFISCALTLMWIEMLMDYKVLLAIIIAILASPIIIFMFRDPFNNYALMTNVGIIVAMVVSWLSTFATYVVTRENA